MKRKLLIIPGVYVLFSLLWIVFSDAAVEAVFEDKEALILAQSIKGIVFVILSGGVIYLAILSFFNRLMAANRRLEKALSERELLLREIHHRVKNNLQIVSSLLSLQMRGRESAEAAGLMDEAQSRIRSIAEVHNSLYAAGDFERVDMRDYAARLVSNIAPHAQDASRVFLECPGEPPHLPMERAVPVGLILNELLTNFYKHVVEPGRGGAAEISLQRTGDGLELAYHDDGPGLGRGDEKPHGLGFKLMTILARQLGGDFRVLEGPGLRLRIGFPD